MNKQFTLFDLSTLDKRKTPDEMEFLQANMELLLTFRDIVYKSFERLNTEIYPLIEPMSRDKNLPAVVISGYLKGALKKIFPEYCIKATKKRFKLIGKQREWIYIKKLDSQKRPSNIETINQLIIINQLSLSKKDTTPNIFLGYTSSIDMTHATGVYAVCIDGEKRIWFSDLSQLTSNETNARNVALTQKKETALKEGTVKIKKKRIN